MFRLGGFDKSLVVIFEICMPSHPIFDTYRQNLEPGFQKKLSLQRPEPENLGVGFLSLWVWSTDLIISYLLSFCTGMTPTPSR